MELLNEVSFLEKLEFKLIDMIFNRNDLKKIYYAYGIDADDGEVFLSRVIFEKNKLLNGVKNT